MCRHPLLKRSVMSILPICPKSPVIVPYRLILPLIVRQCVYHRSPIPTTWPVSPPPSQLRLDRASELAIGAIISGGTELLLPLEASVEVAAFDVTTRNQANLMSFTVIILLLLVFEPTQIKLDDLPGRTCMGRSWRLQGKRA